MESPNSDEEHDITNVWKNLFSLFSWFMATCFPIRDMAGAGLFYDKEIERVKCRYCSWQLYKIQSGVDIFQLHNEASRDCPLAKGDTVVQEVPEDLYYFLEDLCKVNQESKEMVAKEMHDAENEFIKYLKDHRKKCHFRKFHLSSGTSLVTKQRAICGGLVHFPSVTRLVTDGSVGILERSPKFVDYRSLKPVGGNDMRYEKKRLKTFENRWGADMPVKKENLAKAGFQFVGQQDRVQCVYCRGVLHTWTSGDIPMAEHRRAFATCPFVLDMDVGNIALEIKVDRKAKLPIQDSQPHDNPCFVDFGWDNETANVSNSIVIHPEYSDEETRRESFKNWPKTETVSVDALVKCGFFSIGMGDSVRCFCCALSLATWKRGDDPIAEHFRFRPSCKYLTSLREGSVSRQPAAAAMVSNTFSAMRYNFTDSDVSARMDTWVVLRVVEMGYPVGLIRHLVHQQLILRGESFLSCDQLLEAVCSAQSDMEAKGLNTNEVSRWIDMLEREAKQREKTIAKQQAVEPPVVREVDMEHLDPGQLGFQDLESLQNVSDNESQRRLNEELRVSQVCKICMDRPMKIVFLPCGHLVCCEYCAPAIHNCPLCRTAITLTVRTKPNDVS